MLRGLQDVSDDPPKEDPWLQPAFGQNAGTDAAGGKKAHRKPPGPEESVDAGHPDGGFREGRAAARQGTGSRKDREEREREKRKKEISPYGIQRLYTKHRAVVNGHRNH